MDNQDVLQFSIQEGTPADIQGISKVNRAAFGRHDEAHLVDQLRSVSPTFISLAARTKNRVAGHILFTPVMLAQIDG